MSHLLEHDCLILHGHVIDCLRALPRESVHACVTSPPYWGLRSYAGAKPVLIGGNPDCEHDFQHHPSVSAETPLGKTCRKCDAYLGDIGGEATFERYISNIRHVAREIHRVLRDDGIFVLNIGDVSINLRRSNNGAMAPHKNGRRGLPDGEEAACARRLIDQGYPEKTRLLLPHRVAIALMDDCVGDNHLWIHRMDCVWDKLNGLPGQGLDAPIAAHEPVFVFSKRADYYWDREAVKTPYAESSVKETKGEYLGQSAKGAKEAGAQDPSNSKRSIVESIKRGSGSVMRSVISIPMEPFDARKVGIDDVDHFAAYPRSLVRPFILAGVPEYTCPNCAAPWERLVETSGEQVQTLGWKPTCECPHLQEDTIPGIVLDPFLGTGTTAEEALAQGRRAAGCEVSAEYLKIAKARVSRELGGIFGGWGGLHVEEVKP